MISKLLQILTLPPRISNFSLSLEQFFLTVGQNNFGNKIPFLISTESFFSNISNKGRQKMKKIDNPLKEMRFSLLGMLKKSSFVIQWFGKSSENAS